MGSDAGRPSAGRWLAALGPYFAAESHEAQSPVCEPWQSMGELLDDPRIMTERVEGVRSYLGGPESVELRVAASVVHLGLAARALSPFYALAVAGLSISGGPIGLRDLRWQPTLPSTFPLSIADLDHAQPASGMTWHVLEPLAVELCDVMRPFGVSQHILRGNLASALNGARTAITAAERSLSASANTVLATFLSAPLLADTSRTTPAGRFQRRSCCLIYRAAPDRRGALCGDCILAER